jgi:hypothetical protein
LVLLTEVADGGGGDRESSKASGTTVSSSAKGNVFSLFLKVAGSDEKKDIDLVLIYVDGDSICNYIDKIVRKTVGKRVRKTVGQKR